MSYILDALRRADSERERGAVPGLHAQPGAASSADDESTASGAATNPLVWVIVALALVLLGSLAWNMMSGSDAPAAVEPVAVAPVPTPTPIPTATPAPAPPPTAVVAAAPAAAATPGPAPSPAPTPAYVAPPPPAAAAGPREAAPVRATPEPPLDKPLPRPQRPAAEPRQADPAVAASKPAAKPAATPGKPEPAAPADTPAVEPRLYAVNELPEDVRRALPLLAFGGSVHSDTPSQRILIINGQVYNEGGRPTPDVVLEQIRLKSAVLRFRSYRYEVAY